MRLELARLVAGLGAFFWIVVLAARPQRGLLVAQLLAVAFAIAAAAVWAGYPGQLVPAALVAGFAVAVLLLAGIRPTGPPPDRLLRWLVVVGAVGGGAYAAAMVAEYPTVDADYTWNLDHLPMQASLGLAVITVGAVAAVGVGGRVPGWRVPVWTLSGSVAWLAGWSLVYPDVEGAVADSLAVAALAWAAAFATVAESRVRRTAVSPPADARA